MKFYQWKEIEDEAAKECPYHMAPCGYYPGRAGETERSKVVTLWLTDLSGSRKSTRNNEIQKVPGWGYLSDGSQLRQDSTRPQQKLWFFDWGRKRELLM
jgi:hypothetical protein